MQNEPGACSGSKTPRVYRAYSLQATVNELEIIIFVLNYLTVLVHTNTIIHLSVRGQWWYLTRRFTASVNLH